MYSVNNGENRADIYADGKLLLVMFRHIEKQAQNLKYCVWKYTHRKILLICNCLYLYCNIYPVWTLVKLNKSLWWDEKTEKIRADFIICMVMFGG